MIDQSKLNELKKEVKALESYKKKTERLLEKMKNKAGKGNEKEVVKDGLEEEGVVDEVTIDPPAGPQLEEEDLTPEESEELRKKAEAYDKEYNIAEMLLMQKRAGIISETEYAAKLEEAKKKTIRRLN